jgi:hypothetical protein
VSIVIFRAELLRAVNLGTVIWAASCGIFEASRWRQPPEFESRKSESR